MKAILAEIEEIKRLRKAAKTTKSKHLRRDYNKAIERKLNDIHDYCVLRNINITKVDLLIKGENID